jgi:hypothetical protein
VARRKRAILAIRSLAPADLAARLLFAVSAAAFAGMCLLWRDADAWQTPSAIWKLPSGHIAGLFLMAVQIVSAVGVLARPQTRVFAWLLTAVFAVWCLTAIPGIVAHPRAWAAYGAIFEQLAPLCGALALTAATGAKTDSTHRLDTAARIGIGLCALAFAASQAVYFAFTASFVPTWIPPSPGFWTWFTTAAFAIAGIAILANRQERRAAGLLALMMGLFGLLVWVPRVFAHPGAHGDWSECLLTFLITGGTAVVYRSLSPRRGRRR